MFIDSGIVLTCLGKFLFSMLATNFALLCLPCKELQTQHCLASCLMSGTAIICRNFDVMQ